MPAAGSTAGATRTGRQILQGDAHPATSSRSHIDNAGSLLLIGQKWEALLYTQLQCAQGYTGTLCAACQPGYYQQPGFECAECPSVGRSVLLGLLAFVGGVGLVLVTAATNLVPTGPEGGQEGVSAANVVKVREHSLPPYRFY